MKQDKMSIQNMLLQEPKIKYYFSVNTKLGSKNDFELKNIELDNKLDKLTW